MVNNIQKYYENAYLGALELTMCLTLRVCDTSCVYSNHNVSDNLHYHQIVIVLLLYLSTSPHQRH